jgi:hypothetical protein
MADRTQPSNKTMPSQHQDPAIQTLSFPLTHPSPLSLFGALLLRSMTFWIVLLLSVVRKVLVNRDTPKVPFNSEVHAKGLDRIMTPLGV